MLKYLQIMLLWEKNNIRCNFETGVSVYKDKNNSMGGITMKRKYVWFVLLCLIVAIITAGCAKDNEIGRAS